MANFMYLEIALFPPRPTVKVRIAKMMEEVDWREGTTKRG